MKRLLFIIALAVAANLALTNCGSSDEPMSLEPPRDTILYGTRAFPGGYFIIVNGDTVEIIQDTLLIPAVASDYEIEVYSNGMGPYNTGHAVRRGLDAILINPLDCIAPLNLKPIEWPRLSCMANRRGIEDSLHMFPIFKQTLRIVPNPGSAVPTELRSTEIYLSTAYAYYCDFVAFFTVTEQPGLTAPEFRQASATHRASAAK